MEVEPPKRPIDVPTRETVAFLAAHLPPHASVLEIGCGDGHVGAELIERGYRVTAVDPDAACVARTRERGVTAFEASWPAFEHPRVDAVAFTRSLHHIDSLGEALARAHETLQPAGRLLVEDFAFDKADPRTIRWFVEMLHSAEARALVLAVPDELATRMIAADDPLAEWGRDRHHDLHAWPALVRAVAEGFEVERFAAVPYLYRYLVRVLPETAEAAELVERVFREETRLAERGELVLIGRRLVASPRGSAG